MFSGPESLPANTFARLMRAAHCKIDKLHAFIARLPEAAIKLSARATQSWPPTKKVVRLVGISSSFDSNAHQCTSGQSLLGCEAPSPRTTQGFGKSPKRASISANAFGGSAKFGSVDGRASPSVCINALSQPIG